MLWYDDNNGGISYSSRIDVSIRMFIISSSRGVSTTLLSKRHNWQKYWSSTAPAAALQCSSFSIRNKVYDHTTSINLFRYRYHWNGRNSNIHNIRNTNSLFSPSRHHPPHPSRGTTCWYRNKNARGVITSNPPLVPFSTYDEYTDTESLEGMLATYVKVDFGEKVHTSTWSTILLPYIKVAGSEYAQPPKEVERNALFE